MEITCYNEIEETMIISENFLQDDKDITVLSLQLLPISFAVWCNVSWLSIFSFILKLPGRTDQVNILLYYFFFFKKKKDEFSSTGFPFFFLHWLEKLHACLYPFSILQGLTHFAFNRILFVLLFLEVTLCSNCYIINW